MGILHLQDVSHIYFSTKSRTPALFDINLSLKEGEFISIIGPSGCGKSTLLSIISGLIIPTKGTVTLDGETVKPGNKKTGYMLQQDYLFPWKTIEENIFLGLKLINRLNESTKIRALSLLEKMGLQGVEKKIPDGTFRGHAAKGSTSKNTCNRTKTSPSG